MSDSTARAEIEGAVTASRRSRAGVIAAWAWGAVLTLLYLLVVVNAVGNLIGMPQIAASLGTVLSATGWFWLIFGIALPVIAYAAALLIARGRRAGLRLLVLLAGIAVVSAFQLEVTHLVPQYLFFAM